MDLWHFPLALQVFCRSGRSVFSTYKHFCCNKTHKVQLGGISKLTFLNVKEKLKNGLNFKRVSRKCRTVKNCKMCLVFTRECGHAFCSVMSAAGLMMFKIAEFFLSQFIGYSLSVGLITSIVPQGFHARDNLDLKILCTLENSRVCNAMQMQVDKLLSSYSDLRYLPSWKFPVTNFNFQPNKKCHKKKYIDFSFWLK